MLGRFLLPEFLDGRRQHRDEFSHFSLERTQLSNEGADSEEQTDPVPRLLSLSQRNRMFAAHVAWAVRDITFLKLRSD